MANTDWMTQQIPSGTPNDQFPWLALINMLGNTGAGMLKGTQQEWLGAPGGVAANMASNMASGNRYQSLLDALNKAASTTSADPNTPALGGSSTKMKFSPDGGFITDASFEHKYAHPEQMTPVPPTAPKVEPVINRAVQESGVGALNYGQALSSPRNFQEALRLSSKW